MALLLLIRFLKAGVSSTYISIYVYRQHDLIDSRSPNHAYMCGRYCPWSAIFMAILLWHSVFILCPAIFSYGGDYSYFLCPL
ncbi:hypothetical protein BJV82DRAFT_622403 [Fennellomyces sp. T-0311]|nr:hypothetical protein BJV82DRAFT_622403 [Fennellomyces sp. T-0311]